MVVSDKMDKTVVVAIEDNVKHPIYGKIGIKVWIYKGEILNEVNRPGSAPRRNDRRGNDRGDRRDNRRNDRGPRNGERRDNRNGNFRGERKERTPREGGAK